MGFSRLLVHGLGHGTDCLPGVHILHWWKDGLLGVDLLLQKPFQIQEFLADKGIFQVREPALMKRLNLQLQQFPLLVRQFLGPFLLVEVDSSRLRLSTGNCRTSDLGIFGHSFGRTEERSYAGVHFGLLRRVRVSRSDLFGGFSLEVRHDCGATEKDEERHFDDGAEINWSSGRSWGIVRGVDVEVF